MRCFHNTPHKAGTRPPDGPHSLILSTSEWHHVAFSAHPSRCARRTRSRKPTLRIESLEPREVPASLDLSNNVLTFTATAGIDNNVSVTIAGGNFVFTDSAETVTTTIDGATGSGTNTVNVPMGTVTGIVFDLGDGANAINSTGAISVATQNVTVTSAGSALTLNGGVVSTGGNISLSSANALNIGERERRERHRGHCREYRRCR